MSGLLSKVGLVESGPPEAVLGLTRVMEPPLVPERLTATHEGPQIPLSVPKHCHLCGPFLGGD